MTPSEKPKTYRLIALSRDDAVVTITLGNPPVNALAWDVVRELSQAFDEIEGDEEVGAAVVTGGDSRFFSAGADVGEFSALSHAEVTDYLGAGSDLFNRIETFPKPVVAAVNGFALGGGAELSFVCDVRVAAESARFGLPEITLGLIPGWGGLQRLTHLIGKGRALEAALTGRPLEAREALAAGLVTKVTPDAELAGQAMEVAKGLATRPALAVAAIKQRIVAGLGRSQGDSVRGDLEAFLHTLKTDDAKEGIAAFLEKRPPRFHGR